MKMQIRASKACPKCEGRGYIFDKDNNPVPCECKEDRDFDLRLSAARIPKRFVNKTLETFNTKGNALRKRVVEEAKKFAKEFTPNSEQKGKLLMGAVGSGKSHIVIAMLKEIIARGYTGLYYDVPELLQKLREISDTKRNDEESDIIEEAVAVDVLVLDDLGAESAPNWIREKLYLIIDRRYKDNKPILIATSCLLDEFERQVGKRVISRLWEMCDRFADFPEEDYRRRNFK